MSASVAALMMRRKAIDTSPSQLARKLNVFDLTFLGVGATLGAGVYVLTGVIARNAGPGVIVSFLISGFASILSALCYAEFGARVPRAGSAYVYSYVTIGEVLAFTTGWQLLLEYIIGASSVARSWSGYLDTLTGGAISSYMKSHIPNMNTPGLAANPDFIAFGMTMLLAGVCAVGVKESTMVNNLLTAVNVFVILFVIAAGSNFAAHEGVVNFTPFAPNGFNGIFAGAATSFYAYVGFDVIATSAEETKNPNRTIPIAIIMSLLLCACCYVGVSGVIVAMVPYAQIDANSPLASAFASHGAQWAKYIISVGAVCGLSTSLMTCIFPMPRIVYAIAQDGLLPPWLATISPRFNTPVLATLVCGLFSATMALIFDIEALADMMSIGTLMSYTLVAVSILVLRFRDTDAAAEEEAEKAAHGAATHHSNIVAHSTGKNNRGRGGSIETPLVIGGAATSHAPPSPQFSPFGGLFRVMSDGSVQVRGQPSSKGRAVVQALLVFISGMCVAVVAAAVIAFTNLSAAGADVCYGFAGVGLAVALAGAVAIWMMPSVRPASVAFLTPLFPYVPLLSIAINLYLLANLSYLTWIRFAVWCVIGGLIYGFYGIKHSTAQLDLPHSSGGGSKRHASDAEAEAEDDMLLRE